MITEMTLITLSLITAEIDDRLTTTAEFALADLIMCNLSAALFNIRDWKAKHIKKAQKKINEKKIISKYKKSELDA